MSEIDIKFREYLDYIKEHRELVKKAFSIVHEVIKAEVEYDYETMEMLIEQHDLSKYSAEEFTQYKAKFYPTKVEKENEEYLEDDFNKAWEHHKKYNFHHMETINECVSERMRFCYLIEMLCDWLAMSMKFKNDFRKYFTENIEEIKTHLTEEQIYLIEYIHNLLFLSKHKALNINMKST
jgi:hypothetical protein